MNREEQKAFEDWFKTTAFAGADAGKAASYAWAARGEWEKERICKSPAYTGFVGVSNYKNDMGNNNPWVGVRAGQWGMQPESYDSEREQLLKAERDANIRWAFELGAITEQEAQEMGEELVMDHEPENMSRNDDNGPQVSLSLGNTHVPLPGGTSAALEFQTRILNGEDADTSLRVGDFDIDFYLYGIRRAIEWLKEGLKEREEFQKRAEKAEAELSDWRSGYEHAMQDNPDEWHCACVPVLKAKITELEAEVSALRSPKILTGYEWSRLVSDSVDRCNFTTDISDLIKTVIDRLWRDLQPYLVGSQAPIEAESRHSLAKSALQKLKNATLENIETGSAGEKMAEACCEVNDLIGKKEAFKPCTCDWWQQTEAKRAAGWMATTAEVDGWKSCPHCGKSLWVRMKRVVLKRWVNVYENNDAVSGYSAFLFPNRESADKTTAKRTDCIATVPIEISFDVEESE
jgi:hypothetical protein